MEAPFLRPSSFRKNSPSEHGQGEGNHLRKSTQELSTQAIGSSGLVSPELREHFLGITCSDREPAGHLISHMAKKMLKQLRRQFALGRPTLNKRIGFRGRGAAPLAILVFEGWDTCSAL